MRDWDCSNQDTDKWDSINKKPRRKKANDGLNPEEAGEKRKKIRKREKGNRVGRRMEEKASKVEFSATITTQEDTTSSHAAAHLE